MSRSVRSAARSLKDARILVVGWKPHAGEFLRTILSTLGRPSFTRACNTDEGLALVREQGFELVICTENAQPLSPAAFTQALRRDPFNRDPTIPVVVIAPGCTMREIANLRAAGADDIICPPLSADAIEKRFARILCQSRNFIVTKAFIGPDRRRGGHRPYEGAERRNPEEAVFLQVPPLVSP